MAHLLYPAFLYLLGVLLLLPARAIPPRFVAWTAFAWGALAWLVSALLVLILPIRYTPAALLATLVQLILLRFLLFRDHLRRPASAELRAFWLPAGLFLLVILAPTVLQAAEVHPDTFDMLLIAEDLAGGAPSDFTQLKLGLFGLGLPLLHSPAPWLGVAFFYSLPAAFTFTLIAALRTLCAAGLRQLGREAAGGARLANLVTLLFVSTMWIVFQFVYFHNSTMAAMFALLGVGSLWLGLLEGERAWLWLGSLALLGFALTRVETVFFAIAFLAVALAAGRFPPRTWLRIMLPFTAGMLAWYGWLLLVARPETKFLTPLRLLVYLGVISGFYLGVVALQLAPLRRLVSPHLNRLLFAVLGLTALALAVINPDRVANPLWTTIVTFFLLGVTWWGLIWWLVVAVSVLLRGAPRFAFQDVLTGAIAAFFILYLIFGILHGYVDAFDSSNNRMALHILPVIFLYLTLRSAPYLVAKA